MLLQLLVAAAGLWYVFHDPQRRAQIAEALPHASLSWMKATRSFQFEITHSRLPLLALTRLKFSLFGNGTLQPAQVTVPSQRRRRLRVRAAFFATAERDLAERRLAIRLAWVDNALFDADRRLSRRSARFVARERRVAGFLRRPERPLARSRLAWLFVPDFPRLGGGSFTPA
jgi:hypothetical protein